MTTERCRTPDGTSLSVTTMEGAGNPVVLLHGFTGSATMMRPLAEELGGRRRRILVDIVGHGASDAPDGIEPYRMSAVVDQILHVVGGNEPGRVHLVGYSMGGRIALSLAARAPWYFASVTAISATAGISDPLDRATRHDADRALADHIEEVGIEAFLEEWLDQPLFAPLARTLGPRGLRALRGERGTASVRGLAQSLRGTGTGAMPPVWPELRRLRFPLLALAGGLDERYVALAERLAAAAPDGRAVIIEDCGHALPLENPRAVAGAIDAFLESCEEAREDLRPLPRHP